eukprot:TRINITY_DN37435_c0_g1_i1.p1 TRINITY_DN37435_c0_g1~~TRINITY_DN37435_c0_g1_i1.p1  ORF type:complete len:120 (+),score=31.53 TRINITY_DN37435_c0_g1_i1:84-443(+)
MGALWSDPAAEEDGMYSAQTLFWVGAVGGFTLLKAAEELWARRHAQRAAPPRAPGGAGDAASPPGSPRGDPAAPLVEEALRSGGWKELKDAATGKAYYFHQATGRTTWDLAKELAQGQG